MSFNVNKTVGAFSTSLGNGIKAGEILASCVDHVREHGDTNIIVRLMERAAEKGDTIALSAIRTTFGRVFVGARINRSKTKGMTITIKDATVSNSAVEALHQLVADGVSMRGANWKKALTPVSEAKPPKTPLELARSVFARANRENVNITALIASLQTVDKEEAEKARQAEAEKAAENA